jgi:nucleotide-binding universal stress UspA family protein
MKKIVIAFDGSHYSEGALQFIDHLRNKGPVYAVGVFLPLIDYSVLWSRSHSGSAGSLSAVLLEDEDNEAVKENIERFEKFCTSRLISYDVHRDFNDFAIPELKKETRFADLLIIGSERFYEHASKHNNNEYLNEALHDVECPVLIVPEKFDLPLHNILAYDGSADSTYAIRQFAYVLPELSANDTSLLYVADKNDPLPEEKNIKELVVRHFNKVTICRLDADFKKESAAWIQGKPASIIVSGSFGRSAFSRMFHKSFIAEIIQDHRVPVFIAHRK